MPPLAGSPSRKRDKLATDFAWFAERLRLSGLIAPDHPCLLAIAYVVAWVPRIALREERALLQFGIALALAVRGGGGRDRARLVLVRRSRRDERVLARPASLPTRGAARALGVARRADAMGLAGDRTSRFPPEGGKRDARLARADDPVDLADLFRDLRHLLEQCHLLLQLGQQGPDLAERSLTSPSVPLTSVSVPSTVVSVPLTVVRVP